MAAEIGARIVWRANQGGCDHGFVNEAADPSGLFKPMKHATFRADIVVLQIDEVQSRIGPRQAVPFAVPVENMKLGDPVNLAKT